MRADSRTFSRLVGALFGTLKLVQMYGVRHDASVDALENLTAAIRDSAAGEDEVEIAVRGSRLQVHGHLMRAADCGNLALAFLTEEWTRRGLRAVRFAATLRAADLTAFCTSFLEVDLSRPEIAERLAAAIATSGARTIKIERREEKEDDPVILEDRRREVMRTYLRGLRAFRDVLRCDGFHDRAKLRRARRAVQGLVDRFLEDESAVLALAQIRSHDVKLFHHCLHVCIYSLVLGQRLGMNRRQLGALGLAALFHDTGKTTSAAAPAEGDAVPAVETRWKGMQEHPVRGARMLLGECSTHEGMLKASIAAFEHHVHFNGGGFPAIDHRPHLVSRIVSIADSYEALTSPRLFREEVYSSGDALLILEAQSGTLFDPLLLRVFAGAVGIFPVGGVVELSTGELAVVMENPTGTDGPSAPIVRVARTHDGGLPVNTTVDLSEEGEGNEPLRHIVRQVRADEVFRDAGEHVASL